MSRTSTTVFDHGVLHRPWLLFFAVVPVLASAQESTRVPLAAIEEVVVTAQKKTESLQDTPISIAAFGEDTLVEIGAFGATAIGEYTPNVDVYPTLGSSNNITINIRGLGTAEPSLSIDPKTGIYLDGVYIARNAGAVFDIVDLERIEVLRGPQGTLWGKNTTGGALQIITKAPTGEFGFKQFLSAANDGYFRSLTTVDTPSTAGISAKLSYMFRQYDGFARNTHQSGEEELGSEDVEAARLAIAWDISDTFGLVYRYDQTDSDAVPKPLQVTDVGPGAAVGAIFDLASGDLIIGSPLGDLAAIAEGNKRLDRFNLDFQGTEYVTIKGHNLTFTADLGDSELKSITAHREYDSDFSEGNDLDGGAWRGFSTGSGETVATPIFHYTNEKSQRQFSQEFQLVGSAFAQKLDYVTGIFYFEEAGKEENPWNTTTYLPDSPVLLRGIPMGSWYETDNSSLAVYGQFSFYLDDQWTLTLGGRYTEDRKEIKVLREDPRLTSDHSASARWNKFTPSITAAYQATDDLNFYARISEGYNAGVFNPGAINPVDPEDFSVFDQPADEEETLAYEIGMKSEWFDNRLRLNAAIFYNDNQNLQVTDFINGVRTTINSGESTTEGVEIDLQAIPLPGLVIDAGYGYVQGSYDIGEELVDDGNGRGTGRLGVSYSTPVMSLALLSARIDTTYSGKSYYLASSPVAVGESYTLLNARVTLSDLEFLAGRVSMSLWGKNLEDREYRIHGTDFGMEEGFGYSGHVFGDPRSIGLDLQYEY
ncbi:TonB-dependent receptor [Seongchinamella sediminis]|nr:TonB-dependent receptor [Seongchinamella sediminis]